MARRCGRGSDRWDFRTLSSTSDDSVWIAGFQSLASAGNIQKLAYRVRGSEFASRRCAGMPLRFRCRCDPERALYIVTQVLMVAWSIRSWAALLSRCRRAWIAVSELVHFAWQDVVNFRNYSTKKTRQNLRTDECWADGHRQRSHWRTGDPDGHPYGHACGYSRLDSSFWWRHHVHRQTLLKWPLRRNYVTRLIRPEDTVCEVVPGAFV